MILRQTWAVFLDAYRELNSRKLFWITLFISLAVVIALALPSNNERGLAIFGLTVPIPFLSTQAVSRVGFYQLLLSQVGIGVWLTWGATILAIVSTASMIPDLVTSGSIELSLSRPIGRLRFFLTKFAAGLLFVAAQVAVFAIGAFLLLLIRGGKVEAGIFLSIPLVVGIYSFLFSVCALVGLLTRSALTAILATMIFWLFLFSLNTTEHILLSQRLEYERTISQTQSKIEQVDGAIALIREDLKTRGASEGTPPEAPSSVPSTPEPSTAASIVPPEPPSPPDSASGRQSPGNRRASRQRLNQAFKDVVTVVTTTQSIPELQDRLKRQNDLRAQLKTELDAAEGSLRSLQPWHTGFYLAKTALPKTSETAGLLDRWMMDKSDSEGILKMIEESGESGNRALNETLAARPVWWILGTSLAFEAFVLGLSGWIFWRRDF